MTTHMAETTITTNNSGSQVKYSNPSVQPFAVGAGQPVTATVKTAGNPNGSVHGQVPGTSIIHNNPA